MVKRINPPAIKPLSGDLAPDAAFTPVNEKDPVIGPELTEGISQLVSINGLGVELRSIMSYLPKKAANDVTESSTDHFLGNIQNGISCQSPCNGNMFR